MLKFIVDQLEINENDTPKSVATKGLIEGALVGCLFIGASSLIGDSIDKFRKSRKKKKETEELIKKSDSNIEKVEEAV